MPNERQLKFDGLPFRLKPGQSAPLLKEDDPMYMRPVTVADAHVKVFDMNKSSDLKEYAKIYDMAAKQKAIISAEERHWCDKTQSFHIFLRWGELFSEMPEGGPHGQGGQLYTS